MSIRVEEQELSIMDDMLKALRSLANHQSRMRVLDYIHGRIAADDQEFWKVRQADTAAMLKESVPDYALRPDFDAFNRATPPTPEQGLVSK